jgi:hypothetical protein
MKLFSFLDFLRSLAMSGHVYSRKTRDEEDELDPMEEMLKKTGKEKHTQLEVVSPHPLI